MQGKARSTNGKGLEVQSRRAFLHEGALFMLAGLAASETAMAGSIGTAKPALEIGLITDLHYADTPDRGSRNYRESLPKLEVAVAAFNHQKLNCVVALGDLVDALPDPTPESEAGFLRRIRGEFAQLKAKCHFVPGNHCIYSLTKPEFLSLCHQPRSFYSFDSGPFHFVILDACFRRDGVDYGRRNFEWTDTDIPESERAWLRADLQATKRKTVVFVHQRLDLPIDNEDAIHTSPQVRETLEQSGKVLAVFQGHSHVNDYRQINGIHYCTLDAVVGGTGTDANAYSTLSLYADGSLKLTGFARHAANPFAQGVRS